MLDPLRRFLYKSIPYIMKLDEMDLNNHILPSCFVDACFGKRISVVGKCQQERRHELRRDGNVMTTKTRDNVKTLPRTPIT